jgi:hypothetical protein
MVDGPCHTQRYRRLQGHKRPSWPCTGQNPLATSPPPHHSDNRVGRWSDGKHRCCCGCCRSHRDTDTPTSSTTLPWPPPTWIEPYWRSASPSPSLLPPFFSGFFWKKQEGQTPTDYIDIEEIKCDYKKWETEGKELQYRSNKRKDKEGLTRDGTWWERGVYSFRPSKNT